MSWWKRLAERWNKFMEETAKSNDQMWKGRKPSCCDKDKEDQVS